MKQAALIMLTAALALLGCGDAEQNAAQKARSAAVEAEEKARRALIKAAPAEWEAYRNNGVAVQKVFRTAEFPNGGYVIEYLSFSLKKERDALIKAASAEWGAYMTAHNAANSARQTMWTALTEAESALQNEASNEWEIWEAALIAEREAALIAERAGKAANGAVAKSAAKSAEKWRAVAETALKQAAPEQWKTYKAALSEVKELGGAINKRGYHKTDSGFPFLR